MKKLFFDGDLFAISEKIVEIINFCTTYPNKDEVLKRFENEDELNDLIVHGVIFVDNGKFRVVKSVRIFDENEDILTAVTYYFGLQCNLNCAHCHSRILAKDKREHLTTQKNNELIREIIAAKPLSVRLGGGEPLMRHDFISTLKRFSDAGVTTSFTTNGYYLTDDLAKKLCEIESLEVVRLSIHGFDDDHDNFTGVAGSYDRLMMAQKILKKHNLPHKFVVVVCTQTKDKILDFINLAEKVGANGILFRAVKLAGNAGPEQMLSDSEWKAIYRMITVEAEKRKIKIDFAPAGPTVAKAIGLDDKCLCGINTLTIRPSGDFSACGINFKTIANAFETNLGNAWNSHPDFFAIRNGPCPCELYEKMP